MSCNFLHGHRKLLAARTTLEIMAEILKFLSLAAPNRLHAKLQDASHNFHKDVSKKKPPAPYECKGLGTRWPRAFTRPTSNQVCVS